VLTAFVALIMAGSQSGGIPPRSRIQVSIMLGLWVLNFGLAMVMLHLAVKRNALSETRRSMIAELEAANGRLTAAMDENSRLQRELLVQAQKAGVLDERTRLAGEIHDTIAQGLTGIVTQVQAAQQDSGDADAGRHIERAATLARASLDEARRSAQGLSPAPLAHDTAPEALSRIVADWSAATGVQAQLRTTGVVVALHPEIESTLVRIAQEALTNAGRMPRLPAWW